MVHQYWLTDIFFGDEEKDPSEVAPFERQISHSEAHSMLDRYHL